MRRRWAAVALAVAGLLIVGIAAQGTGLQWGERELGWEPQSPPPEEMLPEMGMSESSSEPLPTGEPDGSGGLPSWVTWLFLAILVGTPIAFLLFVLGRRFVWWLVEAKADLRPPDAEPQYLRRDVALVEQAVEAGLAEIDLGTDPRSAIIACWVHFEAASETVGIAREASDTPSDLVRRLLERHELDGSALARLSEAYLRARYSPHDVDEADRDSAREALIGLQRQLGVRR